MSASHKPNLGRSEDEPAASAVPEETHCELTLFVSGASSLSARAIANATRLSAVHADGHYHLAVVDVQKDPGVALRNEVVVAPTLVKTWPLPVRRLVGDLADSDKVVAALELPIAQLRRRGE
jgi:circadian clock protein KaiB